MHRVSILRIPIHTITRRGAVESIDRMLKSNGQHQVATPNPEMIVEAQKNAELLKVLTNTSLNIPDGTGVLWAARKHGSSLPERVTGVDVMQDVCKLHALPSVFLLGAAAGVAEKAASVLTSRNPHLKIVGTYAGSPNVADQQSIIETINASGAQLLFVAYGSPQQELWIARNVSKMPNIRVAMGVGGSFDFIAGVQKRAPEWMRHIGLEWLWRLGKEPKRIGRIIKAVIVFPWLVIHNDNKKR